MPARRPEPGGYHRQARIRSRLETRQRVIQAIRNFFAQTGFLEVETPIRTPAPAPEPHIEAISAGNQYLQASPELYMKRLLAAGHDKIFQICKCFRAGERGERHLTEFTMLEWYMAGADYRDLMAQTEELVRFACRELTGGETLAYQGMTLDLASPWQRMSVAAAFDRLAETDMQTALESDTFDEQIAFAIEPKLDARRPVFLHDYPAAATPLARTRPDRPDLAERYELYIGGMEICNAFSELTDADEQRRRFAAEIAARQAAGRPPAPMPEAFLAALPHMPDAAGCALGLDRLVMLFADASAIDDVVAFVPEEG